MVRVFTNENSCCNTNKIFTTKNSSSINVPKFFVLFSEFISHGFSATLQVFLALY